MLRYYPPQWCNEAGYSSWDLHYYNGENQNTTRWYIYVHIQICKIIKASFIFYNSHRNNIVAFKATFYRMILNIWRYQPPTWRHILQNIISIYVLSDVASALKQSLQYINNLVILFRDILYAWVCVISTNVLAGQGRDFQHKYSMKINDNNNDNNNNYNNNNNNNNDNNNDIFIAGFQVTYAT